MFLAGVISADVRGLRIDCGCFGDGGPTATPTYGTEIARDAALLAVALALTWFGRSRWELAPSLPPSPPVLDPGASGAERRRQRTTVARYESAVARRERLGRTAAVGAMVALVGAAVLGNAVAAATAPAPPTKAPRGVTAAGGIVVGSPSAPHLVIAYEDPQCPVCGEFERSAGRVLAAAVEAGRVKVEYRMRSFLGPESVRAVAALGAAQDAGRFDQLRQQLYAHQPAERTGGFSVEQLLGLGSTVGLSQQSFITAVRNQTYAAWARQVDDRASRDGNTGTPTLILDGKQLSNDVVFDPATFEAKLA